MRKRRVLIIAESPRDYCAALPNDRHFFQEVDYRGFSNFEIVPNPMPYDVVLLDSTLDITRGLHLTAAIKKASPQSSVLLIGNSDRGDDILEAFRLGVKDYIRKPVDFQALRTTIARLYHIKGFFQEKRMPLSMHAFEKKEASIGGVPAVEGSPLHKVLGYIDAHLLEGLRTEDLAAMANLSRYHFIRKFKNYTGFTPKKYIIFKRIEKAKELINNDLTVGELTFASGFNHISNFSKLFKRYTGTAPSDYKKSIIKKSTP